MAKEFVKVISLVDPITKGYAALHCEVVVTSALYRIVMSLPTQYKYLGELVIEDEKNPLYILLNNNLENIHNIGFLGTYNGAEEQMFVKITAYKYAHEATKGKLVYYQTWIEELTDNLEILKLYGQNKEEI